MSSAGSEGGAGDRARVTPPATTPERFNEVLVLVDRTADLLRPSRCTQLLFELRGLLPSAVLHLAAAEAAWRGTAFEPPHAFHHLEGDIGSWLQANPFRLSIVFLAGPASAKRFLPDLRRTQPQASLLGLLPELGPLGSAMHARFDVPEERAGSRLFEAHVRAGAAAVLQALDGVVVDGPAESERAAADAPEVPVATYPRRVDRTVDLDLDFGARRGILSWGRFGVEPGAPDEEAAVLADRTVRPLLAAVAGDVPLRVALEDAPTGLAHLDPGVRPRRPAIASARVLVIARTFGRTDVAAMIAAEAVAAGTPVVALRSAVGDRAPVVEASDPVDLARRSAHLAQDRPSWEEARAAASYWLERHNGVASITALAKVLADHGVATAVPPPPPPPVVAGGRIDTGTRTTQGQVQTLGFAERRPTSLSFARADMSQDQLWPHLAYEAWWDAHPISKQVESELRRRAAQLPLQPLISLVMPVYNTDVGVLTDAIESVLAQTYPSWELCAVDDASPSPDTARALEELAARDDRIRIQRLESNAGIVGASNAALAMARGEFVGLLDHDDLLTPEALFEVVTLLNEEPDLDFVYSDEDKLDLDGRRTTPFFKPSWSPHLHLGVNYVTHFAIYRKALVNRLGGFRAGFDGSQDYDLSLRATEVARRVGHIAKPIYTWRMVPGSAAVAHDAKPYALDAARRALDEALQRRGLEGRVERGLVPGTWRPRYDLRSRPLVSILIPTRNGHRLLERCIATITSKTTYRNFELVIVDNGSDDPETLAYLRSLDAKVVQYPQRFNYARQMNLAVTEAAGDQVLFLNNDMEVISGEWLTSMVELAQHPDVGAVGARLLFPGGRPQHEGVFIGFGGGSAGNVDFGGYFGLGRMIRDATAVTAACMLMRLEPFLAVGGFDERLRVAFNDVDLCLRLRQDGYRILYTPYAELYHAEGASRGKLHPEEDEAFFVRRWGAPGDFRDPFYNPNLDPIRPFRLRR